jgi:VWFA-related protein
MQNSTPARPLSLILVIQTGGGAASQLDKIAHLGALLDSVLTNSRDQAAVITFDSRPQLFQGFAEDSEEISGSLASIAVGNSGAALFDAMHMAISSLRKVPSDNRKVVVLISGEHDHGSYASDNASLIRDVSMSDASVYSLSFRVARKGLVGKLESLGPLALSANAMQKNSSEALAQLTGGEFYRFDSEKGFEDRILEIANHINNRYILTFHPSNLQPGFHRLEVAVELSKMDILSARTGYWLAGSGDAGRGGAQQ